MTRSLDATRSPLAFFGAELRRARLTAGMSQDQLGRALSFSGDLVGKVETSERVPSPGFAIGCDGVFSHLDGLFARLLEFARRWDGPYPQWFKDWVEAEREALSLRWWEPLLVPGLLQSAEYARAILAAGPDISEEKQEQAVAARIERQAILDGPRPPTLWIVLDEMVLRRCVGSPKIMHEQLLYLVDLAGRPRITVQVVPASAGAHAGLLGALIIARFNGAPDAAYLETSADGQIIDKPSVVTELMLRFDSVRAMALPKDDSANLIERIAKEKWT